MERTPHPPEKHLGSALKPTSVQCPLLPPLSPEVQPSPAQEGAPALDTLCPGRVYSSHSLGQSPYLLHAALAGLAALNPAGGKEVIHSSMTWCWQELGDPREAPGGVSSCQAGGAGRGVSHPWTCLRQEPALILATDSSLKNGKHFLIPFIQRVIVCSSAAFAWGLWGRHGPSFFPLSLVPQE